MQLSMVAILVKWNKPPPGWYKLNTDWSIFRQPRESWGRWLDQGQLEELV